MANFFQKISTMRVVHLLSIWLIFGAMGSTNVLAQNQKVIQGTIDLRTHNFETQPIVELSGDWFFYWDKLLFPFDLDSTNDSEFRPFTKLWNDSSNLGSYGFATYKAIVHLPKHHPVLAVEIPDFYSSYTLFLNGKEISRNGTTSTNKENYVPYWLPKTIAIGDYGSDSLEFLLQIANFDHKKGGAYQAIRIGNSENLFESRYLEYGYAFVLTGALLMGGLFFFGLYLFGRHETTILYFSIFCIVYSYRIIGFGAYPLHFLLPDIPWIITLKLEYITLFLSGYLFGIYTLNLYPKESSKRLIYGLSGISILFILITLVSPPSIFTYLVTPYFLVLIVYIVYAFLIYIRATINKSIGAEFALLSTGIVFLVFLYQIMVYFGVFEEFLLFNFVGYLCFFFFQSLILSYRFAEFLKLAKVQAEESSLAKSQFLSTMSHEIRTPLNAVIGLSGLLTDSGLNEKQKEFSETIKRSGENLLSIINNILDYSKIESSKLELEETEFNVRELIEMVFDLTSTLNQKKELELIYKLDENVPDFIIGDSIRLQQVLINLVTNAIKFTESGEIFLHVSINELHHDLVDLQFSLKDTGIGIPVDRMHRLFQSFTQIDASSTRKYGGTGLGLVISKKLIEAMGGIINVESVINKGTTFRFNIVGSASSREKDALPSSLLDGKKIFILDDNQTNLLILKQQLEKVNIEVETFHSSKEFLSILQYLEKYDFGILDMQMPEFDGIEIAEKIRAKWDKYSLPLVLLSSVHELDNNEQKEMFNLYLTKPIKQSQLLNNLERLFKINLLSKPVQSTEKYNTLLLGKNLTILVVEDNLVNQRVAEKILERLGFKIDLANDGKHALEMVQEKDYDLIFMDMEMPIMDGIETTKELKKMESSFQRFPKIIAMTANALTGDKERCIAAGMDDFISKPVTVESVKKILKKWFKDF